MPPTLIEASKAGSSTDLRTSIWAARWKIASGAASRARSRSAAPSRTSVSTSFAPAGQRPVEVLPASGREVVDDRHLVAAGEQRVDQVRPDESRSTCDEAPHTSVDPRALRDAVPARRRWKPLLPSPPDASNRHREEQQRQEDRRDPRSRRGVRRQNLQSPVLHVVRRERRAPHDRAQGPRARPGLPRGLLELAEDRPPRSDRRRADQGADRQKRRQSDQKSRQGGGRARDRDRLRPRGRADRARGARGDARREPRARLPRGLPKPGR